MPLDEKTRTELEAAAFRRLVDRLAETSAGFGDTEADPEQP